MSIAPRANVAFCPAVDTRVCSWHGYRLCLVAAFLLLAAFCCRATSPDPLTKEEREWLHAHGPLRYAPHLFAPPLEFRSVSNSVFGITPEILNMIVTNFGLQIEWVISAASPLEVVAGDEADFALAYAETRERDNRLQFTQPYLWVSNVFFVRRDAGFRQTADLAGRRIGVVQGYAAHEWLQAQRLTREIVPVATMREGLLLLSAGRLDAMLCPDWVGQRLSMATGLINLRTLPQSPLATPQQFVVANKNKHLLSILQKGLDRISAAERERIVRSWAIPAATEPDRPMPPWVWKSLLAATALGLALVLWNLMLRRQVAQRTRELQHDITKRKHAEAVVCESRALLHSIIEGTDDAVFAKDTRGRYLLFNSAAARMTGKKPDEVVGRDDTVLFPPEEARKVMAIDQRIRERKQTVTFDEALTFADGKKHALLVTKGPLLDEQGQVIGLFGISRDVTERVKITEALRESEARLAAAQRIARLGSWELGLDHLDDVNANPLWWSDEVYRIFGYIPGQVQVTNDLFFQGVHPEDRALLAATVQRAIRECKPYEIDHRIVLPDGAERIVHEHAEIVCNEAGKPLKLSGTVQDVTERRRTEAALRESERRLKFALEGANDGIWDIDLRTQTFYLSPRGCEMFGYHPDEFTASRLQWRDMVHPDDLPHAEVALQAHLSGQTPLCAVEQRLRTKDGGWKWVLARGKVAEIDPAGKPWRLTGTHTDITERKQAEEIRAQLEAQLRQSQKMEAVGQLAGGVAHDFNNILAALLMNVNLLQENISASPEIQAGLADMQSLVERAAALTRQLLLFGRRQVMQPRVLDLNSLLGNLLKMLGRLIGEHITLTFQGGRQSLWIEVDPGMTEQVITNLVVNARDAMPRGGRLTLRAQAILVDHTHVSAHPQARPGSFVALSVQDTGIGMDEATLKRIFEPFFTTKDIGKGTGLGLSTVYGIIEQHQGWIEVESIVGQGSTFTVYWPAHESPQAEADSTAEETPIVGGAETILVVEDEPAVRELIVCLLERYGYRVLDAANGPAALRVWQEHGATVDLLLSDMVMPEELGGFDLAERLRKLKPSLRVIFMSGYSAEMMSHGFGVPPGTSFLQKPFAPAALARLIREVLDSNPSQVINRPELR